MVTREEERNRMEMERCKQTQLKDFQEDRKRY